LSDTSFIVKQWSYHVSDEELDPSEQYYPPHPRDRDDTLKLTGKEIAHKSPFHSTEYYKFISHLFLFKIVG
jgi:hypothetical protein